MIVPVGEATITFPGMITVNATGAFLWERLESAQTLQSLAQALTEEYEVTPEQALKDVQAFTKNLIQVDAILED